MQALLQRVQTGVRDQRLLRRGQRVVVAVSGGVDSMVLLHLLQKLAGAERWQLVVAHLNHRLRGADSRADERFVRAAAARLQLPCHTVTEDVRAHAMRHGLSLEMAARECRHAFLARVARAERCPAIALAHHADDQVELFFLRLLRGAGPEGLAGMRGSNPSPADARVRLVRPLLAESKAELLAYAREAGVRFREDVSNASREILRNRVRHELLPWIEQHAQPAIRRVVLRQMELLGAESDFVAQAAAAWRPSNKDEPFARLHTALQRRLLLAQLERLGVPAEFELIERLRLKPGEPITVAADRRLVCDAQGNLQTLAGAAAPALAGSGASTQSVSLRGRRGLEKFDGLVLRWQLVPARPSVPPAARPRVEWFDADRVGARITLRHWRPGDRFQPSGLARPAKLQDLFTNAKIPRARRHELVVAETAAGELWWVEGLRIAERFKLGPGTRRRLRWAWRRG